ncbi:MAG: helix-turn-helix domain-containing protein [Nannocystales bacterium]
MAALQHIDARSPKAIGAVVRLRRKAQQLTQVQLGELALVGPRFIGELEAGKASLQLGKVLAVLEILGVRVSLSLSDRADA